MEINYELIGLGIFCTVGLMQYLKNIIKFPKELSWIYAIIMPVVGIGCAFLLKIDNPYINLALPVIVGSQIGYEGFVQNFLERFKPKAQ